jgi:hypothetical protein
VVRGPARGVLSQIEALLADPATEVPAHLRGVLAALAGALAEQTRDRPTVTPLDTPLARAWRAHPLGRAGERPRRHGPHPPSRPSGRPPPAGP